MAIVGVDTILYGVEDLALGTRFFEDFGLPLLQRNAAESVFRLAEGSTVLLRRIDHPSIPQGPYTGFGVKELILGVDSQAALDRLVSDLRKDRDVTAGEDHAARFRSDCGLPLGLRVFDRKKVLYAPDPINASGNVSRLNQHRKWRQRALPKTINHVVFGVKDYWQTCAFFRERLNFRLSDHQKKVGVYLRADGANEHHNLFLADCNLPGMPGNPAFHHTCFGVEDVDEVMVGTNYMTRRGWTPGFLGSGRHRIGSALFSYLKCPAGGEAEYGADTDYLDDSWRPREWEFHFGMITWMHDLGPFAADEPSWDVQFYKDFGTPPKSDP